jgi:hypothetical protein
MRSSQQRLSSAAARVGMIVLGLFGACHHATAAQLVAFEDCNFLMHVPGVFGGTDLHLKMQKGAVFTEDGSHKFCGLVSQATPFGESNANQCFVVTDGKLISGKWSDKVTSSTCVLTDATAMHTPFVVGDLAPWAKVGAASLHGQAFLKTVGGDVKTCAGARVLLLPGAAYVDELLAKKKAGVSVDADQRLQSYTRATICDAQGNFSFAGLPEQRWYVLTTVTWGVPHMGEPGEQAKTKQQGGELVQAVALTPGDNQVFLTYRDE